MQLLLGCGHSRQKRLSLDGRGEWRDLVTLDFNPDTKPDVVHDLSRGSLPFGDGSAEEIHLYDVLEHLGAQGDFITLLAQFQDYWRVLRHGGLLFAIVPRADGVWAWGDPGHTRLISYETLTFLHQPNYTRECRREGGTNRSDYRRWFQADFDLIAQDVGPVQFAFVLRAVKPSRITPPEIT